MTALPRVGATPPPPAQGALVACVAGGGIG